MPSLIVAEGLMQGVNGFPCITSIGFQQGDEATAYDDTISISRGGLICLPV